MRFGRLLKLFLLAHIVTIFLTAKSYSQDQPPEFSKISRELNITLVSYNPRRSATIAFVGTGPIAGAKGTARVRMQRSTAQIEARFEKLKPPTNISPEYASFVLWAVTSDGATTNLGEIAIKGQRGEIKTAVPNQTFGMIVTAEPYFAIGDPSSIVLMQAVGTRGTIGTQMKTAIRIDMVQDGVYEAAGLEPFVWNSRAPRELFQARNAVRIAEWQGASQYAADMLQKAKRALRVAELSEQQRGNKRDVVVQSARQAVQLAEGARVEAIRGIEEERLARERKESAEREAAAEAARLAAAKEAEWQLQLRAEAEEARLAAAEEAERQNRLRAEAEAARVEAETAWLLAAQEAESARQASAEARELLAQAQAEMRKLEAERQDLRARLHNQFNMILETRDTARGLILNMGDVLFDVGKSDLRQEAREKLARLSGVLLGYPSLNLEIEGHTDNTGSDETNQRLSEQRSNSVRSYLVSQSVRPDAIVARGFGETMPIALNDTRGGRQQNRRVEIVVTGDVLGDTLGGM